VRAEFAHVGARLVGGDGEKLVKVELGEVDHLSLSSHAARLANGASHAGRRLARDCACERDYAGNIFLRQGKKMLAVDFFSRHCSGMKTALEIVDYIGSAQLMAALGVKADAVRKAVSAGRLPASWYHTCEELAGRPLPREAFSFKRAGA